MSSADLDRVMVDQLRAVASEYRRQRDELGVALALALGALNRLSGSDEKAEAEVERLNGAIDSHLLTTQARATGRCIACDGPTKLFAHGMHYAVRCKNPECVKTYAALADCRKETAYIESCELKLHNAGLSIDDGLLAAIGDVVDERDAARAEDERLEDALYEASREVRDHKSAREMAMTVVNQAWVDMAALSARAEKAEAEVERLNGAIDSHLQNLREIERGARELDAERMKSNACAEGLAAALRKIQNYTDETITCGWAREALEKFGGGE